MDERTGIFDVAVVGTCLGKIRDLPIVNEPLVRLPLTAADLARLGEGLLRLGRLDVPSRHAAWDIHGSNWEKRAKRDK